MHIHLSRAAICADCDSIYSTRGESACPACGGSSGLALAPILNRTRNEEGASAPADFPPKHPLILHKISTPMSDRIRRSAPSFSESVWWHK